MAVLAVADASCIYVLSAEPLVVLILDASDCASGYKLVVTRVQNDREQADQLLETESIN